MIVTLLLSLAAPVAPPLIDPCEGATTAEVNACAAGRLARSKERLGRYLEAALRRYDSDDQAAVRLGIEASQDAFEAYRSIECATVYESWKQGTIRTVMDLSCEIALTDQRTHAVWRNWLRYMDNTPPVLPEPKPTE